MQCQCEHMSHYVHLENKGNAWSAGGCPWQASVKVRTPYGMFNVCANCAKVHLHDYDEDREDAAREEIHELKNQES